MKKESVVSRGTMIFHHLVDICQVHTVLQDDDRDVRKQSSQNAKCDKNLKTGWYRFMNIPGITMATESPQCTDRCALVEIHFIVIQDDNFGR